MRTIDSTELVQVLNECISYVKGLSENEIRDYFAEFAESGLFHDAVGKVWERDYYEVKVTTNY